MFGLYTQINLNYADLRSPTVKRFAVSDAHQDVLERIVKLDEEIAVGVKELGGMLK